jgi:hypothetical protein
MKVRIEAKKEKIQHSMLSKSNKNDNQQRINTGRRVD